MRFGVARGAQAIIGLVAGIGLAGCSPTVAEIATKNRMHLAELSLGMSKQSVQQVLGSRQVKVRLSGLRNTRITNPHKSEAARTSDGRVVEVWYVMTDMVGSEFVFSDDELTPLVFQNDELVGWGWNLLFEYTDRQQLHQRYDANPPKIER